VPPAQWFEICATRYSGDTSWIEEIRARLDSVATKEDLKELIIRNTSSVGGSTGCTVLRRDRLDRNARRDPVRLRQSPNYYDPVVIIGGVMSHLFFTVPLALVVKRQLRNFSSGSQ
jgi:hypothetical protein